MTSGAFTFLRTIGLALAAAAGALLTVFLTLTHRIPGAGSSHAGPT